MTIEQVINKFKETHPKESTDLIKKSYEFAKKAHQGQKRLNNEDQLEHLLMTAFILAQLKLDAATLAGGFLHDILEYTPITLSQIQKEFGDEIAFLVDSITQTSKIKYRSKQKEQKEKERQTENLRKIFLTMAKDIRVVLIKLANRLHNSKTLYALAKEERERIALETLEIYAPLAHRLGIGELKGQLEDAAFSYVYPQQYQKIMIGLPEKYQTREKYCNRIKPLLEKLLKDEKIKILEIHSRAKHHYSLYKKLLKYDMNWDKIYDLVAVRIIVPDVESCYGALGAIHKKWKPLIGRIKDYIATPKPNGYKSLHTTVFCEEGKITEFQIRTPQMHKEAEYGIAAHWYYDEKKGITEKIKKIIPWPRHSEKKPDVEKDLIWVKQLQDWQKEKFSTAEEFLESLRIDFFKNRIFVFTPQGDVIDLPEGATPIDFAYHIHSQIGDHCDGAKVDGKMISLNQPLENGQVVEIITKKNKKPSQDWLKIAKTSQAKSRIRSFFKK